MGCMQVISGGILTTIQDAGRRQCQQLGLAEAGAMDKHAFFWANRLVGNQPDTASLEILLGNCSFQFNASALIALTGADAELRLNGIEVDTWSSIRVSRGDTLCVGIAESGLRMYLAIAGGLYVPHFFGSASTAIREKTGGIHGNGLAAGDTLFYPESAGLDTAIRAGERVPAEDIPDYTPPLTLRFFPGYNFHEFTADSVQQCLNSSYTITQDADRMGYRLSGPRLTTKKGNILSIGIPCGTIQVPTAGEPIILLNDRQSTGGYPVLGVVCARDIFRLSQRRPGDTVRFALGDLRMLSAELRNFYTFFHKKKPFQP